MNRHSPTISVGEPRPPEAAGRRPWRSKLFPLGPLVVLLAFLWPILAGRETWYLRDLFNYHLGAKTAQARAMRDGFLPLVDPFRAGGQALVGNLNNVPLYPDNLLYLVTSPIWALNAHVWLHLLLAPIGVYALARAWGLKRETGWVAGFCYALSGFFLSQLNLYNLVAGAALAPAFAAACLTVGAGRRPKLAAACAGVLWALLLLAGDPIVAAMTLFLGLTALVASGAILSRSRRLLGLGLALVLGTVVAAPQIVEFLRILGSSYRGSLGYGAESRLVWSWDPRTLVELLVPLFFGPPDQRHWGDIVLGSAKPLYFSLFPGLVAVALVLASGRPRSKPSRWAWSMLLAGGFLALGGWNPFMFYLYRLPQAASLRYPIKAWLLVAIGAALLAGIGFERSVLGDGRRSLLRALAAVGGVAAAAWLALVLANRPVVAALGAVLSPARPASLAIAEVARWRAGLLISLATLMVAGLLLLASRRAPRLAGSALVAFHVASQLVLLEPLLDTDSTDAYKAPPRALSYVAAGERIAHGCPISFACDLGGPGKYRDWRMSWIERRAWLELFPLSAATFGLRSAFNTSPEGLDSLMVCVGNRAFRDLRDADGLRLLAASAVDVVLLGRQVEEDARDQVRLRARLPTIAGEIWIYELRHAAAEARIARRVHRGDLRRVMVEMLSSDFDPARDVFVPGQREGVTEAAAGEAVIRSDGWERVQVATASDADGLLVLGRAWLPLYRATVDGAATPTFQANLGQLAVAVPAGRHQVEIWVDRGPFEASLWASLTGSVGLLALALWGARGGRQRPAARRTDPAACQTLTRDGESSLAPDLSAADGAAPESN